MDLTFDNLSDYQINLLCAKHELKGQPFIKFLKQRDIFGSNIKCDGVCEQGMQDNAVYIITESRREQRINFMDTYGHLHNILVKGKINIQWDADSGGFCTTDTSFFIPFENETELNRAIVLTYLVDVGVLSKGE